MDSGCSCLLHGSAYSSQVFSEDKEKQVRRGDLIQLVSNKTRLVKFLGCIFIGLPIWYTIGILITFAPKFATALGVPGVKTAGDAVMYSYLGLAIGDLTSGFVSQLLGSRKKVVAIYLVATLFFVLLYLFSPVNTTLFYYFTCFALGCGIGYWALFVTIAAEQFGTNLRSTVATSVPNIIRGTVIPITLLFMFLKNNLAAHYEPTLGAQVAENTGIIYSALIIGGLTIVIAFIALRAVDETFGRDLNFEETD